MAETNNTTIQKLINLANNYDRFTCYIENYRQEKEAEKRNEQIEAEFIQVATELGIEVSHIDFHKITSSTGTVYSKLTVEEAVNNLLQEKGFEFNNKEEEIMSETTNTTATINNETTIKEGTSMRELINKAEQMISATATITKTSDANYVDKKMLAQMIHELDKEIPVPSTKKNSRPELIQWLKGMVDTWYDSVNQFKQDAENTVACSRCGGSGIFYTRVENNTPIKAVPDDGMCYRCNGTGIEPIHVASVQEVPKTDARAKTDKLFALIKSRAADNNKKGFGYTISSFMLQACILNAGAGIEKLKGHTVTAEEDKMTQDIYSWLKKKGFIKPLVYSVVEDDKVRVYMPEYNGRTDTKHVKMIPWAQSAGYTAKKVTSFLVTIK